MLEKKLLIFALHLIPLSMALLPSNLGDRNDFPTIFGNPWTTPRRMDMVDMSMVDMNLVDMNMVDMNMVDLMDIGHGHRGHGHGGHGHLLTYFGIF